VKWIFVAFLLASIVHIGEEYFYPGGFMDLLKRLNPRFAPLLTTRMAMLINGLQLLLCAAAIVVGRKALAFSTSPAALLFVNSLVHIGACVRTRGYAPGVVSGTVLYLPLSMYAYYVFAGSGQLSVSGMIISCLLGLLYQTVPAGYVAVAAMAGRYTRRA
jgi:hypothetical protein